MRLFRSLGVSSPLPWKEFVVPLLSRLLLTAERSMLAEGEEDRYVSSLAWLTVWSCAFCSNKLDLSCH